MRTSFAYVSSRAVRKPLKYKAVSCLRKSFRMWCSKSPKKTLYFKDLRTCVLLHPYGGRVSFPKTGCDGLGAPFKAPLNPRALCEWYDHETSWRRVRCIPASDARAGGLVAGPAAVPAKLQCPRPGRVPASPIGAALDLLRRFEREKAGLS